MSDLNEVFVQACTDGDIEVVKQLSLDPRVDVATQNNQGFRYACYGGHIEVVKYLSLDSRVDVAAQNNEGLRRARGTGCVKVVKFLKSVIAKRRGWKSKKLQIILGYLTNHKLCWIEQYV